MGARSSQSRGPGLNETDGHLLEYFRNTFTGGGGGTAYVPAPPGGIKATGGTVTEWYDPTPGKYWRVHIFEASGTFATTDLSESAPDHVEFLLVGGGGAGGGAAGGGGGGAGGVLHHPAFPVIADTDYAVVIGAGGAATAYPWSGTGGSGTVSTIAGPNPTVTANGGGGAGGADGNDGANGGSGGGSSGGGSGGTYGGIATSNQADYTGAGTATAYGNSGGRGFHVGSAFVNGGGGGGAGAVGRDSTQNSYPRPASEQNNGGDGQPFSLTGSPIYFAGGGGGGAHYTGGTSGNGGQGGGGGGSCTNQVSTGGANGWSEGMDGMMCNGPRGSGGAGGKNTGSGGGGSGGGPGGGKGGEGGPGIAIFKYEITAPEYRNTTSATGGDIYYTSNKTVHVFRSSGTLVTPATFGSKTAEYVVIGGGGGGAPDIGGGGGAGCWKEGTTPLSSGITYPMDVGGGGAGDANGVESFIGPPGSKTVSSPGGGRGGNPGGTDGQAGGSGGGSRGNRSGNAGSGGGDNAPAEPRPTSSPSNGYGNDGGGSGGGTSGGGGGGAGGVGQPGQTSGAEGGLGLRLPATFRIAALNVGYPGPSGSDHWLAGGGGSSGYPANVRGTGGAGNIDSDFGTGAYAGAGPGTDGPAGPGIPALVNSGSGGGGAGGGQPRNGGAGGSGIILIAYPTPS